MVNDHFVQDRERRLDRLVAVPADAAQVRIKIKIGISWRRRHDVWHTDLTNLIVGHEASLCGRSDCLRKAEPDYTNYYNQIA